MPNTARVRSGMTAVIIDVDVTMLAKVFMSVTTGAESC